MLKYVLRPPISQERITRGPDGLVRIALKKAFSDGTVAIDLDPLSLLTRLCAAVPPPRRHTVRYVGVLASASKLRPRIVPTAKSSGVAARRPGVDDAARSRARGRYRPWAELLKRTFALDVLACPRLRRSASSRGDDDRGGEHHALPGCHWRTCRASLAGAAPRTAVLGVHYKVTPKKEKFVAVDSPVIVDEAGHEIKAITDDAYRPSNAQVFDTSPGTIGEFEPIYEIPKDAKKLRARIVGKAAPGVPTLVNLKL